MVKHCVNRCVLSFSFIQIYVAQNLNQQWALRFLFLHREANLQAVFCKILVFKQKLLEQVRHKEAIHLR